MHALIRHIYPTLTKWFLFALPRYVDECLRATSDGDDTFAWAHSILSIFDGTVHRLSMAHRLTVQDAISDAAT